MSPGLGVLGCRLLAVYTPEQWPVEWHLPWWLATNLGLPDHHWRALTVCNLLGLGFVQLQDQLAEQKASAAPPAAEIALAGALHEAALAGLAGLFAAKPDFWEHRQDFMAQWRLSLLDDDAALHRPFAYWREPDVLRLAWRGAPLKITAAGACLLAERADLIPRLLDALDHLLAAQVLLDHLDDWREDLAGGRFNAFVAYASDLPQDATHRDANHQRVLTLLMAGDASDYFDLALRHALTAQSLAAEMGCDALVRYAACWREGARLGCERLVRMAYQHLTGAVRGVLAPKSTTKDGSTHV
jgi:hypothetical protein